MPNIAPTSDCCELVKFLSHELDTAKSKALQLRSRLRVVEMFVSCSLQAKRVLNLSGRNAKLPLKVCVGSTSA